MSSCPTQLFIRYFNTVPPNQRWAWFTWPFFWRIFRVNSLDRTSCGVSICLCCILMVKKLKTFHTSEFPVCSFCKTWRFFTATSKQPLDYSKFVKYQPKYLKSCTQFLSQLSFLQREMLGDFYCRVYNWSKPPIATPRKCMYCAFTCINSKHFIHQKNSESLATIPIS